MMMNDAISRSAVLALSRLESKPTYSDLYGAKAVVDTEDIEKLPALDVAPVVHARWIMNHFGAKCSNCLRMYFMEPSWSEKIKHMPPTWIYCPNCGARMDGEDDE